MLIHIHMKTKPSRPTSIRLDQDEEKMLDEIQKITGEKQAPLIKRLMRLQLAKELKHLKDES